MVRLMARRHDGSRSRLRASESRRRGAESLWNFRLRRVRLPRKTFTVSESGAGFGGGAPGRPVGEPERVVLGAGRRPCRGDDAARGSLSRTARTVVRLISR